MPTSNFSKVGIRILVTDFDELGQVSKQISVQFKTSLNSLRPSISELRLKKNEQKSNGVTELREAFLPK
jgi:hypothetical protein